MIKYKNDKQAKEFSEVLEAITERASNVNTLSTEIQYLGRTLCERININDWYLADTFSQISNYDIDEVEKEDIKHLKLVENSYSYYETELKQIRKLLTTLLNAIDEYFDYEEKDMASVVTRVVKDR